MENPEIPNEGRVNTTGQRHYTLKLTEAEMQAVSNGIAGFYRVVNREKRQISAEQTGLILNVMDKFRDAYNREKQLVLPR